MFVALRDLRFALGRFALIGSVVALITLLVGFLSGLTVGLALQNISAVLALPGDRIVFSMAGDDAVTYADSAVSREQADEWTARSDVSSVAPLGILQATVVTDDSRDGGALFGAPPSLSANVPAQDGTVDIGSSLADSLGVAPGDVVSIVGADYTVAKIVDDLWYSHTAVTWMTLHDWRLAAASIGSASTFATVLVVTGDADYATADASAGTVAQSVVGSLTALSAFRSEIGSLGLIIAMLFAVSVLVIGTFFTVWGMQRKNDFAVLKALGASNRTLELDAMGQAALLLVAGVGLGVGLTVLLGGLAASALPFVLNPLTTLVPGAAMVLFGLLGAVFATRSVTRADPLTALGSSR